MTISRWFLGIVSILMLVGFVGCGGFVGDGGGSTGQVEQPDTGSCILDCTSGEHFSCSAPCSTNGTTLTCPDGTRSCPAQCVPTTCSDASAQCGTISDGCGGTLSCGTCPSGKQCRFNQCLAVCSSGRTDCCQD